MARYTDNVIAVHTPVVAFVPFRLKLRDLQRPTQIAILISSPKTKQTETIILIQLNETFVAKKWFSPQGGIARL